MSRADYEASRQIVATNPTFDALIMAAMLKGDSTQAGKLNAAWPELGRERYYRHWSAGGLMPGEEGYDARNDDNLPVPS